jgi:uncharacterized OsmC-like protein
MELIARHLDGVRFEVTARGHRLVCDQPPDNGGVDAGMTPPELLLASLATCAGYYAVRYLQTRQLPTEAVSVRVVAEKAAQPARLGSFRIEVAAPGLDERHSAGVLRAVKTCLIHNTLLEAPLIETVIHTDVSEPALQ